MATLFGRSLDKQLVFDPVRETHNLSVGLKPLLAKFLRPKGVFDRADQLRVRTFVARTKNAECLRGRFIRRESLLSNLTM